MNSACRVSLKDEAFQKFVETFLDENKPDPMIRRQMESWSMTWKDMDNGEDKDDFSFPSSVTFEPSHYLQGTLQWTSDDDKDSSYMAADLYILCCWRQNKKDEKSSSSGVTGSLYFSLHGSVRFPTKSELKKQQPKNSDNKEDTTTKAKNADKKIRAKMMERLRNDAYISHLLFNNNKNGDKDEKMSNDDDNDNIIDQNRALLCEAKIHLQNQQQDQEKLEERVYIHDDHVEGLRRSMFSKSETILDMIEVLVGMPFLPCRGGNNTDATTTTTPIANRAKLRLLEDAMYDACENEGDEECIQDLKISSSSCVGGDNNNKKNDSATDNPPQQKNKNGSKKRRKQS